MSESIISYGDNGINVITPAPTGAGGTLLINNDKALSDAIDLKLPLAGTTSDVDLNFHNITGFHNLTGATTLPSTQTFSPILPNHTYTLNLYVQPSTAISISLARTAGGSPVVISGTTAAGSGTWTLTDSSTYHIAIDSGNNTVVITTLTIFNAMTVTYVGQVTSNVTATNISASSAMSISDSNFSLKSSGGDLEIFNNGSFSAGLTFVNQSDSSTVITTGGGTILDDGFGNLTVASNLYIGLDGAYLTSSTNSIHTNGGNTLDDGSGGAIFNYLWSNSGLYVTGTSTLYGNVYTPNNVLEDGQGNASFGSGNITLTSDGANQNLITIRAYSSGSMNACVNFTDYNNGPKFSFGYTELGNNFFISNAVDTQLMSIDRTSHAATFVGTVAANLFSGSGASLTSLNGTNISSGTVADARLSSNVPLKNTANTYTSTQTFTSIITAFATKTSNYNIANTDSVILVNSASNITMTLPSAASAGVGREYTIKTIQSAATVGTTSSQTIDGSTTYALTANRKFITVICDGSNWQIIGSN